MNGGKKHTTLLSCHISPITGASLYVTTSPLFTGAFLNQAGMPFLFNQNVPQHPKPLVKRYAQGRTSTKVSNLNMVTFSFTVFSQLYYNMGAKRSGFFLVLPNPVYN